MKIYEYGYLNGRIARKNLKKGNVQFELWKDKTKCIGNGWVNFDKSWWQYFIPNSDFI